MPLPGRTYGADDGGQPELQQVVETPKDAGAAAPSADVGPPDAGGPLKAFVTSTTHQGSAIGGLAGADLICNQRASAAKLPGTYRAWISVTGTNAIDRMIANGPWVRVDGQPVAATRAALGTGSLATALDRDENGQTPALAEDRVWTGTAPDGKHTAGADCNGWTAGGVGQTGHVGEAEHKSAYWTSLVGEACSEVNRIYCFQQ